METIPKSDCQKIGFFRKTHGVFGELLLDFDEQFEYSVEDTDYFFVDLEGLLVPFYISDNGLRFRSSKTANVKFDWVNTEHYAKRFIGASVYLHNNDIIDEPEETISSFKGYTIVDLAVGKVGVIEQVDDYAGNIVFTVMHKGKELLLPFHEEMLVEINETNNELILKLPDGLVDI